MRVVVTGATGTIGSALCGALLARGDYVVALSRDAQRGRATVPSGADVQPWPEPTASPPPAEALAGADAVAHLLGAPVSQRWTEEAKREILDSRVLSTRMLVAGLRALAEPERPRVLISQSATGLYGPHGSEQLEESAGPGSDFLAQVVIAWEHEAEQASELTRVVLTRTGVVLSPSGGALATMLPFFRMGLGGPVAGGEQYVPWIHLDDVVGALMFCVDNAETVGAVNLTAPNPVTNAELSHALGHVLRRPAVLPVPGFAVRALYGKMSEIVTTGQRVVPARLQQLGYEFAYPEVVQALSDVLKGDIAPA